MEPHNRYLDCIVRGPAREVGTYAQQIIGELRVTLQLPRWGEWRVGTLLSDQVLCTHCIESGVASDKITVVAVTSSVLTSDVYLCGGSERSFQRTQLPEQQPIPAPEDRNILQWSHQQCCAWLRQVNPGFWRYVPEDDAQPLHLNGKRLLSMTSEDWQEDYGVTVSDHLKQLEASIRRLRSVYDDWLSKASPSRGPAPADAKDAKHVAAAPAPLVDSASGKCYRLLAAGSQVVVVVFCSARNEQDALSASGRIGAHRSSCQALREPKRTSWI